MFVRLLLVLVNVALTDAVYAISDDSFGEGTSEVSLKQLSNLKTGEFVSIIPEFGGRVEELYLVSKQTGSRRQVLKSHNRDADAVRNDTTWTGCILAPFANRIAGGQYSFGGNDYQLPINEPSRNGALHGFVCTTQAKIEGSSVTADKAEIELSITSTGDNEGYPFLFRLSITYTLNASGFTITPSVVNLQASLPLPFYLGWHPYFLVNDVSTAVVQFDSCVKWGHVEMTPGAPREGTLIPTTEVNVSTRFDGSQPIGGTAKLPTYFDDEFKALTSPNHCDIIRQRVKDNTDTMVLWQDSNYRFAQIYTGAMEGYGVSCVALEPMSAMADAFNNHDHLPIISAGEEWTGRFGIYLE